MVRNFSYTTDKKLRKSFSRQKDENFNFPYIPDSIFSTDIHFKTNVKNQYLAKYLFNKNKINQIFKEVIDRKTDGIFFFYFPFYMLYSD